MPVGISLADKVGKVRHEVRVRWWLADLSTYRTAAIGPPDDMAMIPDVALPEEWKAHPYSGPPVLFGHYLVYGKTRSHIAAVCVSGLQRRQRWAVGSISVGR